MELKIRNKTILTLIHTLEKAVINGCVPKHFEISPTEAYCLLCEMNDLHSDTQYKNEMSFAQYESCEFDIKLWMHSKKPLSREHGTKLVRMWTNGQFGIKVRQTRVKIARSKTKPIITATVNGRSVSTQTSKNGVISGNIILTPTKSQ